MKERVDNDDNNDNDNHNYQSIDLNDNGLSPPISTNSNLLVGLNWNTTTASTAPTVAATTKGSTATTMSAPGRMIMEGNTTSANTNNLMKAL
ncbi:hypothetical protein IV203_032133 [Nitzschia inconspicua]|uniref:Uncharacterized protein n=1 Tax=Nitzschia inconspicua TaxID=303405 RepID=A0A9K3LX57_9STRA|nr:hypothetical protein IV203_032133 [Nitzschia inconspicua]